MPMLPVGSSKLTRWAAMTVLGLAVMGAALGLGGVIRETIIAVAAASALSLAVAAWRARQLSLEGLGVLLLFGTAITWLQLVPLPLSLVQSIAPLTAAAHTGAAAALGQSPPGAVPLTLDPQATRLMGIWWLAVTATYLTARRLARRENQAQQLLLAIPLLGLVVVGVGLVHAALGAEAIYGRYEPSDAAKAERTGALYLSTFLNPNHLAAFLNLGAPIALAHALTERLTQRARILWLCAFLVLVTGIAMTSSRAGLMCGGLAALLVLSTGGDRGLRGAAVILGLGVITLLALVSPLGTELASLTGVSLVDATDRGMHQLGLATVERWPWTGVGRGAFAVAHTQVNDGLALLTVTHAHNSALQLLADYGVVIGGILLLGGVLLMAGPIRASVANPITRGAAAGLIAVGIHNLVDFNLDILGVAVVVAVVCGVLRVSRRGLKLQWPVVVGFAVATLVLVGIGSRHLGSEPGPRRDAWILANPVEAAARHPADAYAFLGAGMATGSMPQLEHAATLHPHEPRIQLAMAAVGPAEGRLEHIRAALSTSTSYRVRNQCFALINRFAKTGADVMAALGPDPRTVAAYLRWDRPPKEPVLRRARQQFAENVEVIEAIASIRLAANDLDAVDDLATLLMIQDEPDGYRLKGLVLRKTGRPLEAYYMYREAGDPDSLLNAAEAALAAGEKERALAVLERARVGARHLKRLRALKEQAAARTMP